MSPSFNFSLWITIATGSLLICASLTSAAMSSHARALATALRITRQARSTCRAWTHMTLTGPFDWSITHQVNVQLDELSNVLVLLLRLLQCEQTPLVITVNVLYLLHSLLLLHSTEQTADMRCGVRRKGWRAGDATNHVASTLLDLLCLQRGEEFIYSLGAELEKAGTGVRDNIANWQVLIAPIGSGQATWLTEGNSLCGLSLCCWNSMGWNSSFLQK